MAAVVSPMSGFCLAVVLLLWSAVPEALASRPVLPLMPHLSKDPLSHNSKDPISDESKDPLSDKRMLLALMKGDTHLEAPAPSPDSLSPFLEDPMAPSPDAGDKMFKHHHPRHPKHPKHPKHPPKPNGVKRSASSSSSFNPDEILNQHNIYRSDVGLGPLQWSETRVSTAQAWANTMASLPNCGPDAPPKSDAIPHSPALPPGSPGPDEGENLAGPYPADRQNPALQAVKDWHDREIGNYTSAGCQDYHYADSCCKTKVFEDCGHYVIMISPDYTSVGCATAPCGNRGTNVVCHYL